MDPLSAFASLVAVVQIADRVIGLCKTYITGIKDAPADLRSILIEVGSVKCVLEVIDLLEDKIEILKKVQSPIKGCREALESLETLFPPQSSSTQKGKRQRLSVSLASLAWPFKREKVLKLLDEIGRHKSTICLSLTTEAAQDLKHIKRNVEKIRETTTEFEMNQILRWLVTTDPSKNHNSACRLHEELTGEWLTNLPEYASWKAGNTRFLWLHGIPGAGKTILHSYIAENVKKACREIESEYTAHVYYYCHFGHVEEEASSFLRWSISQLCRKIQGIPSKVREMFNTGRQPKINELLDVLGSVVKNFSRIYITIDALDEASDRSAILNTLCKIVKDENFNHIHLLATSRKQLDIERILLPISTDLSLSNPYVDEDIRTYVSSRIKEDPNFSRWPEELKAEIEKALVKGAKGMFRWAFFQLDILRRLNTISKVRLALTQLPETLDETYERILCNIPPEHQTMVNRILNLVAYEEHFPLYELQPLLGINLEAPFFDRERELLNPWAPVEACMCLLICDQHETLRLAHYTVKEFLMSPRIYHGPAKFYQMTNDSMCFLVASCYIVYLLHTDHSILDERVLKRARNWNEITQNITSNSVKVALTSIVTQLFDPMQPHWHAWAIECDSFIEEEEIKYPVYVSLQTPRARESTILANMVKFREFEIAANYLAAQTEPINFESFIKPSRYPFSNIDFEYENMSVWEDFSSCDEWTTEAAFVQIVEGSRTGHEILSISQLACCQDGSNFLELFIRNGVDINAISPTGYDLLATALSRTSMKVAFEFDFDFTYEHRKKLIELLLAHNAKSKNTGCVVSPIQSFVGSLDQRDLPTETATGFIISILSCLINRGADVNAVGDDPANVERIRWTSHFYLSQRLKPPSHGKEEELTTLALHNRGRGFYYDTPLRILERMKTGQFPDFIVDEKWDVDYLTRIEEIQDFLRSHGAHSLHLFPVKSLPGYVEKDMEEWNRLSELKKAAEPS